MTAHAGTQHVEWLEVLADRVWAAAGHIVMRVALAQKVSSSESMSSINVHAPFYFAVAVFSTAALCINIGRLASFSCCCCQCLNPFVCITPCMSMEFIIMEFITMICARAPLATLTCEAGLQQVNL